jgi:cysteine sulfinate desulfinase/cysteine desulfurase-like protein
MLPHLSGEFGNASSTHAFGRRPAPLDDAQRTAHRIGAEAREIV